MASSNVDSGALPSQRLETNPQSDTSSQSASSARSGRGRRRNPRGKMPAQGFHGRGSAGGSSTGRSSPPGTGGAESSEVGPVGGRREHMHAGGAEVHGHHAPGGPSSRPDEPYSRPSRGGNRKRRGRHAEHPGAVAGDDYSASGHSGRGGGGRGGAPQRGRRDMRREPKQDHQQQHQQQHHDGRAPEQTSADDPSLNANAREFVPTGRESAASASAPVHTARPNEQRHSHADGVPGAAAYAHFPHDTGGSQHPHRAAGRGGRGAPRQPKATGRYENRSEKPYLQQEQEGRGNRRPFDREPQGKPTPRRPATQESSKDSCDQTEGSAEMKSGGNSQAAKAPAARRLKPTIKVQATGSARADEIIQELASDSCECMVCCDVVERKDKVWSCYQCYRVFHMRCIQRWGRSDAARVQAPADGAAAAASAEGGAQSGWRCPSCRTIHEHIPTNYWCFCGNTDLSEVQRRHRDYSITPHSCGNICGKQRAQKHCSHRCNQLCHPGPCPPCPAMMQLSCGCGRTTQTVRCSQAGRAPTCSSTCGRALACGRHQCASACHDGPCDACEHQLEQTCYCGRNKRQHSCAGSPLGACAAADSATGSFSCNDPCHRPLTCGNHLCELPCHSGPCPACQLSPEVVNTCHCGQTMLTELAKSRESCMDPIPTCRLKCNKVRTCGPVDKGEPHRCLLDCHEGACRPCPARSERKCQCGQSKQKLPCKELLAGRVIVCERMCNAKRSCGRHRCNQRCCTDGAHVCMLVCGKRLQCNQHKCEELCHRGHCDRCWQTIFDELRCGCGAEVLYPPQPCGTRPPPCTRVCARVHPCEHEPRHCCHTEDACPPCPVLVSKPCMGGHELRNNVPCHLDDVSCGRQCAKLMPCGEHSCDRMCHRDACLEPGGRCKQPCTKPRPDCRHSCAAECHPDSACPDLACYASVMLHCACGRRSLEVTCAQASGKSVLLNSLRTSDLARHMSSAQSGGCVSFSSGSKVEVTCDDVCAHEERIRKMAEALQLDGTPAAIANCSLSQFLIDKMKTEPAVVQSIDAQISELVAAVLRMPPNSHKTASLAIMNRENRRIVHEIAELYTCESQGIDAEPQRSVRVTAFSHSYRPTVPLSDLLRRIQSQAKAAPVSAKPPPPSMAATPGPVKLKSIRNEKIPDYFSDP